MNSDAFFSMGKTHEVCQDYARAGDTNSHQYAIVSDGCSSSPDTDFGSRFLTLATIQGCERFPLKRLRADWVIWRAEDIAKGCNLSPYCLDATLLAILPASENSFNIHVCGDGVVIIGNTDGSFDMWDFDCAGAPSYLSYLLDDARLASYYAEGYGIWKTTHYRRDPNTTVWVEIPWNGQGEDLEDVSELCRFSPQTPDINWKIEPKKEGIAFIMVVSDGIHSFQRSSDLQPVPIQEVANHLVDFKSFTGQFVTRRCRAFEKFCVKERWHHNDDLGVAAIYTKED